METTMKLEGIKRTYNCNVAHEAGAKQWPIEIKVDFSKTTVEEILDLAKRGIVIALQGRLRKKGEGWLKDEKNRKIEGMLGDLLKASSRSLATMSSQDIYASVSDEKKEELKALMIKDMVERGEAKWIDEAKGTFEIV